MGSRDLMSGRSGRAFLAAAVLAACLAGTGCGGGGGGTGGSPSPAASPAAGMPAGPPPRVLVEKARREKLSASFDWPAQTQAGESVDVRARVEGTLENFDFDEGFRVHSGQVLFTLDDAPYQAQLQAARAKVAQARANLSYALAQVDVRKAKADLASARADLLRAQQNVDRYTPLAKDEVIPQQTLDDAIAQRDVAKAHVDAQLAVLRNTELSDAADIEVARANVEAAEADVTQCLLNIGYCTITSPINGVIGKLNVDPGNLVGQMGNTNPLVSISRLDPMYVNFSIAEADYLAVAEAPRGGTPPKFALILADGRTYPHPGRFGMIDRSVDVKTGTMAVRAVFPNPAGLLREGQFGRIRVTSSRPREVVLVPQRAVTTVQSLQIVYLVGEGNKVLSRNVETGGEEGADFIIASGLKGGERVIVDGIQKVKAGVVCDPHEESTSSASGR